MEATKNNNILNQELVEEKKTFRYKTYEYFLNMLWLRKEPSFITLYIFHFIEIIQLISFAFSAPHINTWNISENTFKYLHFILSGFRITPLLFFTSYTTFSLIFILLFLIFAALLIFLIIQIMFRKENSKVFAKCLSFTQMLILPLKVVFIIPIIELFLIPFNCEEQIEFIRLVNWGDYKCWSSTHLFYIILGIIGAIVFLIFLMVLNYYYFYPFFVDISTTRLNSNVDTMLILIKVILIIQYIFLNNEYESITILLLISFFLIYCQLKNPIYNAEHLELFLNLRNIIIFWTYLILFIAKITKKESTFNNKIYLMLVSYPLVIYCFIMYFNERRILSNLYGNNIKFNDINSCISNIRILMQLINSFVREHTTNANYRENFYNKDIIILKGIIENHTSSCIREDCPLTKFIKNEGIYTVQKQALLSHMSFIFVKAIQSFPNDLLIRILYVQFNYDHKYNLSTVRTTFEELKKMKMDNKTKFIIFCQERTISQMRIKTEGESEEQEQNEKILLEQNYQRLKNLISNITKLYAEFWGIFEAKVTNSLNIQKLYKLGENLNFYLKEVNTLWENELKNKKLNFENEPVAQLYSLFLKEILWDKKKSDLVQKKINEEHNLHEYNKVQDENTISFKLNSLESQDLIIFVKSNEKGKCTIVQFSNSLSYIIGYERYEILNKPFEILLPAIFKDCYSKKIENYIRYSNMTKETENDSLKEIDKKKTLTLIKNKMGYINPFYLKCSICEDNDFSDSFLIRMKLESVDFKSMYAFYILARPDFSIESISSSAINLGLSMDLLKKYVIKLNILIRSNLNKNLNLFEKYKEFENVDKKITWVFPDIIYPKDDSMKDKEKSIQDLIKDSKKAKFNLQIIEIRAATNDIGGYIFKIFEPKKKKQEKNTQITEFIPSLKNQIIFDLLNLKYIRTIIVSKKSGLRNLREEEEYNTNLFNNNTPTYKSNKKKKESQENREINEDSSNDEYIENKITKEKMLELQTKDSIGIKLFINTLSFFGKEISLIRHRPNRELYPTGKAQEPLIKISLNDFTKRIYSRIKDSPFKFKKAKSIAKVDKLEDKNLVEKKYEDNNNMNKEVKKSQDKTEDIVEINKDLFGENTLSLKNIVNINSITRIKLLDFLIYIIIIVLTIIEFILSNNFFKDQKVRYKYFKYSYDLLNGIVYIKYFLTEGVLTVNTNNYILSLPNKEIYLTNVKKELTAYHTLFSTLFAEINNPKIKLSNNYRKFVINKKVEMKTWNNGAEKVEYQPLQSAQTKLMNALIYISNSSPDKNVFSLDDKYIYELLNNLLNSHYDTYENIIFLIMDDFSKNSQNKRTNNLIILIISLAISIIYLYFFWYLMIRLDNDREKPVNLFLTIKNKIFEDLKNSSENFSNKLLNKFFGVDENEEESQQNYTANVKPNDINITKFTALNEYKETNNKGYSFIFYYIQFIIFLAIFNIIMIIKCLDSQSYYRNIENYITVYNITRFSEIYLMTRIDITKQYLENPKVGNYEFEGKDYSYTFLYVFLFMSGQIENTIKEMSKTDSFLRNQYKEDFMNYFYHEFTKLINNDDPNMQEYSKYGFKVVCLEVFEMLRYLYIKYTMDDERDIINRNISNLINDKKFIYLDVTIKTFFKPWYEKLVGLIDSYFYSYLDNKINILILIFIIMIILISIFYWIIWKRNEEQFINKIEKSFDLINLIPEEIKTIIVTKLNEAS